LRPNPTSVSTGVELDISQGFVRSVRTSVAREGATMARTFQYIGLLAALGVFPMGCAEPTSEQEFFAQSEQAVNICSETPAANLIVDGIPAYAQCAAASSAAIYSNNGVDTATSSQGTGWVRTQFSGGYQCTELLHRYWVFRWNVTWIPNGDAGTWCSTSSPSSSGLVQTATPVHGDAIVFAPGICGADTTYGHVALIDTVDTTGSKLTYIEQNNAGRRTCAWSCAKCFLHVVANDGAAGGTGKGGASATGGRVNSGGGISTSTGGASSIQTTPLATGRSNVGGQAASTGTSIPDPAVGCSISVPQRIPSGRALGLFGLALVLYWRRWRSQPGYSAASVTT